MVPGTVHTLDALITIDDLEDLADEGAGLLGRILQRTRGDGEVGTGREENPVPGTRGCSPCSAQRG